MRIYLMTDMEGVAGVLDFDWLARNDALAKELLTAEVNAAVAGFFDGGADSVVVADGHGSGGINPALLDARVELLRGWGNNPPWPLQLDAGLDAAGGVARFDALAFVGQHAKAGTELAHMAHTQSLSYVDLSINGVSIGEFGQLALCAGELGIPTIFGAGDLAFTLEAQALIPGIETVSVKRGLSPGRGDELDEDAYRRKNRGAIHLAPAEACRRIREGAARAVRRARAGAFGVVSLQPPFERVTRFRPGPGRPTPTISRETHPSSFAGVLNLPFDPQPVSSQPVSSQPESSQPES